MSPADRRTLLTGALAGLLAGCGEGTWLGETAPPPLPGERKSVLLIEDQLRADPRLAELNITLPPAVRNPGWPQSGGNATHAMEHLEAADSLTLAWRVDVGTGGGSRSRIIAGPVVADGKVFTVDADGMASAVDVASGRVLWQFEAEAVERIDRLGGGAPAFGDGRLYMANGNGMVFAVDAGSGEEIWRRQLKAPVRSAPTAIDGRVLMSTADSQLFALDGATSDILWQHAGLFEQTGILGGASPAATNEVVIAPFASGEVVALTLDTGQQIWNDTVLRPRRTLAIGTMADIVGDPVITGSRVIVAGASGEMASFDLEQGSRDWTADVTSMQTPWVAGNFIYVLTERNEVVCMVDQGGRVRWVSPLGELVEPDNPDSSRIHWTAPVLVGGRLLLANSQSEMVDVSPFTGEVLGKAAVAGPVTVPGAIADGTVYFLTDAAELLAYR